MIGYSLSFCVTDILYGLVDLKDVEKIVIGTAYESWDDWKMAINYYCRTYWMKNPRKAARIVWYLLENDKIEQPLLLGESTRKENVSASHWSEKI